MSFSTLRRWWSTLTFRFSSHHDRSRSGRLRTRQLHTELETQALLDLLDTITRTLETDEPPSSRLTARPPSSSTNAGDLLRLHLLLYIAGNLTSNSSADAYELLSAMAEWIGPAQQTGATPEEIEALIKWSVVEGDVVQRLGSSEQAVYKVDTCSICLVECVKGDVVTFVKACSHVFHSDCIASWLECNKTCPNCRKDVL
jgi:hypothetical protein